MVGVVFSNKYTGVKYIVVVIVEFDDFAAVADFKGGPEGPGLPSPLA